MRRAGEAERAQLNDDFAALCAIPSPSGDERACADWLIESLAEIGLAAEEDDAGPRAGANAGNLLARLPGRGQHSLMLCAHMDTVPPTAPLVPVVVDEGWENDGDGILGADNKAAVVVMLALARRLAHHDPPEVGLELVFTVSEENGLHGARAFDIARLRSAFGFVFDHATPIGDIVTTSPTYHRLTAELRGRAAHAGLEPELGRSAIAVAAKGISHMRLGRLDAETTANVGTIAGGTAANVVAERCRIEAEVRAVDERRVESLVTEMIDTLQDAADGGECDLDVTVERMFRGYRVPPRSAPVALAEQALTASGYTPRRVTTGGGSDANAFEASGFSCVNLANGTERAHQPTERVSIDALEGMLEVAIALHDGAAAALA